MISDCTGIPYELLLIYQCNEILAKILPSYSVYFTATEKATSLEYKLIVMSIEKNDIIHNMTIIGDNIAECLNKMHELLNAGVVE